MAKTIEQLKAQGAEVKNATVVGENTATRVGTLFTDIVEHVEEYEAGQTADTEANTLAINQEAQARAKADEQLNTAIETEKNRAEAAEQAVIFDVSVYNNGAVFESISALLSSSNLSTLIPTSVRHGGMSIRFIQGSEQSSDNKYVQYRLMTQTFSTDSTQWQGVDDEPTSGSKNLVESGGIFNEIADGLISLAVNDAVVIKRTIDISNGVSNDKIFSVIIPHGTYFNISVKSNGGVYSNAYLYFNGDVSSTSDRVYIGLPYSNKFVKNYDVTEIGFLSNESYITTPGNIEIEIKIDCYSRPLNNINSFSYYGIGKEIELDFKNKTVTWKSGCILFIADENKNRPIEARNDTDSDKVTSFIYTGIVYRDDWWCLYYNTQDNNIYIAHYKENLVFDGTIIVLGLGVLSLPEENFLIGGGVKIDGVMYYPNINVTKLDRYYNAYNVTPFTLYNNLPLIIDTTQKTVTWKNGGIFFVANKYSSSPHILRNDTGSDKVTSFIETSQTTYYISLWHILYYNKLDGNIYCSVYPSKLQFNDNIIVLGVGSLSTPEETFYVGGAIKVDNKIICPNIDKTKFYDLNSQVTSLISDVAKLSNVVNNLPVSPEFAFEGKKLSVIGDSISTYKGYIPEGYAAWYPNGGQDVNSVDKTWWKMLSDRTHMTIGTIAAWSGSTVCGDATSTTNAEAGCSTKRVNDLALNGIPDIIICYIGYNDIKMGSSSRPLGEYKGNSEYPTETSNLIVFSDAYATMLKKIMKTYPHAMVLCCTLLPNPWKNKNRNNDDPENFGYKFPYTTDEHKTMQDYNERIREIARNFGLGIIDLADCGITWENWLNYTDDAAYHVHPSYAGQKMISYKAEQDLINYAKVKALNE